MLGYAHKPNKCILNILYMFGRKNSVLFDKILVPSTRGTRFQMIFWPFFSCIWMNLSAVFCQN